VRTDKEVGGKDGKNTLRPFYPLPSNLLFNTCFTTSSSLSPSFSILTPSLIPPRHPPYFIPLVSLLPLHLVKCGRKRVSTMIIVITNEHGVRTDKEVGGKDGNNT
jgi:hypothetical protein